MVKYRLDRARIEELLKEKRMRHVDLARKCGMKPSLYWATMKHGGYKASLKLAPALGATRDEILMVKEDA